MGQVADAACGKKGDATVARPGGHVLRGIVFAALGGICWGFSGTCAQLLTSGLGVPVSWITCVRLLIASAIFLVVCLVREPKNLLAAMRDKRSIARIVAFALLGVLLTQVSYLTAISYTNAGTGTVLERLGLILIMFYVCLRVRRLPKVREVLGLVFAIAGTFLIATKGNVGSLAIPIEGLFWGLISAFALAFYTLIPGKVLEKWGSFIVTGLAMLIGGCVSTAFVQPWTIPVEVNWVVGGTMIAMIIVGTFAAYLFYLQGITDAGPVRAGLVGCVEPVSATVISALWLGTPVTLVDVAGCALILIMVFLVTQRDENGAKGSAAYDGSAADLPLFEGRASRLGYYNARLARTADFARMRELLEDGHRAMAELGVKEGVKRYPSSRRLMRAIREGTAYVVVVHAPNDRDTAGQQESGVERIIGVFAVDYRGDQAYEQGTGAHWASDSSDSSQHTSSYAALHWVTVDKEARRCGVGRYMLGTAERLAKKAEKRSIRADVYEGNKPMHALLEDYGYQLCGTIVLKNRLGRTRTRTVYEYVW